MPECTCGAGNENAEHFFLHCNRYDNIRAVLKAKVETFYAFELSTLLFGSDHLSRQVNELLFDAVHEFITESHRFD